jgi:hypothetical protein
VKRSLANILGRLMDGRGPSRSDLGEPGALDRLAGRGHGLVDNLRDSGTSIVSRAGREGRRLVQDASGAGASIAKHVRREGSALASDVALHLDRFRDGLQRSSHEVVAHAAEALHHKSEAVSDSVMAKVLVVTANVLLVYGAYIVAQAAGEPRLASVARVAWGATTLLAVGAWGLWELDRRRDRILREILAWQLYIVGLAGLTAAALAAAAALR